MLLFTSGNFARGKRATKIVIPGYIFLKSYLVVLRNPRYLPEKKKPFESFDSSERVLVFPFLNKKDEKILKNYM